jgi:hypothetical protein
MSSTPAVKISRILHKRLSRPFYVRVGPNDEDIKDLTDVVYILYGPSAKATVEDFERDWVASFEIERLKEDYTVLDIWDRMREIGWIGNSIEISTDVEY